MSFFFFFFLFLLSPFFFFFSSRRRHTRSYGDWSSDVCSSDLGPHIRPSPDVLRQRRRGACPIRRSVLPARPRARSRGGAGFGLGAGTVRNDRHHRGAAVFFPRGVTLVFGAGLDARWHDGPPGGGSGP